MKKDIELKKYVKFYGMSSDTAMNKHSGGVANYRSSEGRTVEIPYKGEVENTVLDTKYKPLEKIKILLENNPFHKIKFTKFEPLIHSMKDGSGINWHNDSGHSYGITYYTPQQSRDGLFHSQGCFYKWHENHRDEIERLIKDMGEWKNP